MYYPVGLMVDAVYRCCNTAGPRCCRFFFFQAEDGIRDVAVTGVQTCALPISYKLFIGGKQVRPDQGYSRKIAGPDGRVLGEVGEGNRKDIRNAVEAAHAAEGWGRGSGHTRAQILYFIAENLATRAQEFADRVGREEVE